MPHDPAFDNAGKKPGLEIWRIQNFKAVAVPTSEFGYLYSGDCYIVLSSTKRGRWNVHFWLGNHCTVDEQGTAALKTVELDDFLGGGPVQYREVEGHESPLFLSYFKGGIKYMKGGHESGFRKISDRSRPEPRLFCCKGRRNVRCKQVKLSKDSLNTGDVFILDNWTDIYVWCPPDSGRMERTKGIQIANDIRDQEHAGRGEVHVLDFLDESWNSHETFWKLLGGHGTVKSANMGGSDDEQHTVDKLQVALYKISDASGKMKIDKVGQGDITLDLLDPNDCFILDAASSEIFVWLGKKATADEKKKSMEWAASYLELQKKPLHTPIVRVLQDAEPSVFLQWFKDSEEKRQKKFKPRLYQCSDESGKLVVEEMCNFRQEELDGDDVMILDVGDIIYVWLGKLSNEKEKKHARKTAEKYLDATLFPRPATTIIRTVHQEKEGNDFTKYFSSWNKKLWQTS